MADMFNGAILFNAPLNSWNTSAVTNMNSMFNGASRFEQNIRGWVVSNVTDSTNFSTGSLINGTIFSPFTSAVTGVPGSIYLRGSGQHLVGATNTSLMLSGNFTIEFYLRNGPQVGENYIFGANSSNNSGGYTILANNVNGGAFAATDKILVYKPGVGGGLIKGTTTLSTRTWIHVAIVRNGTSANNVKLYVNGVFEQQSSDNNVWDYATNGFIVGAYFGGSATYNYVGRLSNFRIVNGTAVYTSNFTPPTTTLTSIPGTSLLLNTRFGNSLTDSSPNNITVTAMNNPVFDVLSPVSS
jgi:surface protein